jgi:hypothetical protein
MHRRQKNGLIISADAEILNRIGKKHDLKILTLEIKAIGTCVAVTEKSRKSSN